jgi:hypothetical protein
MLKRIVLAILVVGGLGASVLVSQSASACSYSHKQAHIT